MRSTMAAPHTSSQRDIGSAPMQRPCEKNQAISTSTDTAHSAPIIALL